MLSFGQPTEGMHNVTFCVFQELEPQICGGGEASKGQGPQESSIHCPFLPSFPTTHSLGSLSFFIFLLFLKYAHMLLLGDTEKTWVVVRPAQVSAGAGLHLLGNHTAWGRSLGCDNHRAGSLG